MVTITASRNSLSNFGNDVKILFSERLHAMHLLEISSNNKQNYKNLMLRLDNDDSPRYSMLYCESSGLEHTSTNSLFRLLLQKQPQNDWMLHT